MPRSEFIVRVEWDDEAGVWYVSDSDLPGLVAEAETVDALREKVIARAPELAELNRHLIDWEPDEDIPVHLMVERLDRIRVPS
ncbi:DUF1902 domain-containing protein [Rhodovibrio salinarum]|uniref:DUF1902 domain-containing protein n=1 Tax=Rhodovibrio salinarum TaxID=1087 RepID=A0A934QGV2_9PROT|nr:DUF1902 domain-containing protein [Rhodovibrio salinarum]MBK1696766.1 DUF1902 domain-containing protein [Rhodovibrio salinarum]